MKAKEELKMNKPRLMSKSFLYILSLFFIIFFSNSVSSAITNTELTWQIEIGDSQTFIYRKIYNLDNSDPLVIQRDEIDQNGEQTRITVKTGTSIRLNISSIDTDSVYATFTYNNTFTTSKIIIGGSSLNTRKIMGTSFLQQAHDNKSYWLEIASLDENLHLQGNLLVREEHTIFLDDQVNITKISKRDWTTGWLVYLYYCRNNASMLIREEEFVLTPNETWLPQNAVFGTSILIFLTSVIIIRYVFSRKKQKSENKRKEIYEQN